MTLPNFPTDNLYKFLALSGIALLLAGAIPFHHTYELERLKTEVEGQVKIVKAKTHYLRQRSELQLKTLNTLYKDAKKVESNRKRGMSKQQFAAHINTENQISDATDKSIGDTFKTIELTSEIEKQIIESETLLEITLLRCKQFKTYKIIGICSILIGVILAIIGFLLWYYRLQVHLDKLIVAGKSR